MLTAKIFTQHAKHYANLLALVAQSYTRQIGDHEFAGSIPARSGNILPWRLRNIFYGHSVFSAKLRRAVVSFWQKNVHKYLVNSLED